MINVTNPIFLQCKTLFFCTFIRNCSDYLKSCAIWSLLFVFLLFISERLSDDTWRQELNKATLSHSAYYINVIYVPTIWLFYLRDIFGWVWVDVVEKDSFGAALGVGHVCPLVAMDTWKDQTVAKSFWLARNMNAIYFIKPCPKHFLFTLLRYLWLPH